MTEAAAVTSDTLLGGRVALQQPAVGYRVAIDPVLLAAAVPASPGERALDVGCGVGAGTLCLASRVGGLHVTGIEVERSLAQLASENAALNRPRGPRRRPRRQIRTAAAEIVAEELRPCLREPAILRGAVGPAAAVPPPRAGNHGGRGRARRLARILRQDGPSGRLDHRHPPAGATHPASRHAVPGARRRHRRLPLVVPQSRSAARAPGRPPRVSSFRQRPSMAGLCGSPAA